MPKSEVNSLSYFKTKNGRHQPRLLFVGNLLSHRLRSQTADIARQFDEIGYHVSTTSSQESQILRLADMLFTAIRYRRRYDIVFIDTFDGRAFIFAELISRLCKTLGKKVVHIVRSGSFHDYALTHNKRVSSLFQRATLVVTPSLYLKAELEQQGFSIKYVPNGFNLNEYQWLERKSARPRLLWLRSFHEIYDPIMAVNAFEVVYRQYPTAKLTMAGPVRDNDLYESTKCRVQELGLEGAVAFLGFVPPSQHTRLGEEHDIFLCTTRFESFGVSNIQAGALGLCPILTKVGEIPHIWTDNINTDLVDQGDYRAMGEACLRLIEQPGLVEKRSISARENAERFSWPRVLPLWEQIITQIDSR
jgi:L-malate glycosyltransferase